LGFPLVGEETTTNPGEHGAACDAAPGMCPLGPSDRSARHRCRFTEDFECYRKPVCVRDKRMACSASRNRGDGRSEADMASRLDSYLLRRNTGSPSINTPVKPVQGHKRTDPNGL